MNKKKRLLREGTLRKKCDEQALFTCSVCGEQLSRADWKNHGGDCPVCVEGTPIGHATCATCKEPLEGIEYDAQDALTTPKRRCHSITVFEKTGKVVFDPSGESDGHEIPQTKPKLEPAPPPQADRERTPETPPAPRSTPPDHPFYFDIVLATIAAAFCLFFAVFGLPENGRIDLSVSFAAAAGLLGLILAIHLCRLRFESQRKQPGRFVGSFALALVLGSAASSSLHFYGLNTTEMLLYGSAGACLLYAISRLGFRHFSGILTLAFLIAAGYFFVNTQTDWFSGGQSTPQIAGATVPNSESDSTSRREPVTEMAVTTAPRPKETPGSALTLPYQDRTTAESAPIKPTEQVSAVPSLESEGTSAEQTAPQVDPTPPLRFATYSGKEFAIFEGKPLALDISYKLRLDRKLRPIIKPQRDIFRDYEKELRRLLKAKTDTDLAKNYRRFIAWKEDYRKHELIVSGLMDQRFESLKKSAGAASSTDLRAIEHARDSGEAFRLKIDALIEKYRPWYAKDTQTATSAFESSLPWEDLRKDFQKQLERVRGNLEKFPD